jgi:hypothetical protein
MPRSTKTWSIGAAQCRHFIMGWVRVRGMFVVTIAANLPLATVFFASGSFVSAAVPPAAERSAGDIPVVRVKSFPKIEWGATA